MILETEEKEEYKEFAFTLQAVDIVLQHINRLDNWNIR